MVSPSEVLSSVLPVYLLILAGAGLRKTNVLRKEHDEGILRLIFQVMMPCFTLDKILGSEILRSGPVVFSGIAAGVFVFLSGISIGWICARALRLERGTGMRTFALTAGCPNYGFTAIPVIESLFGSGTLALLFVHNIGVEVAIWSIGVMLLSGSTGIPWKKFLNGPMLAVVTGLALIALRLDTYVAGPGREALSWVGAGAFPIAIVLTGASMIDQLGTEKPQWLLVSAASLVRLALAPAAILCAARFLPLATELKQVLIVQAAMPAAMTPILLARLYGGRPGIAVHIVVATTILSFATLPWIIAIGVRWVLA